MGLVSEAPATGDYGPLDLVGTGRHLTKDELRTWTRFLDAGRLLEEVLARHLSQQHSMTHTEYEVLVRLDGAGGRMRMNTLARQVVASSQNLSKTADRLERRGWIERMHLAEDARGIDAVLLPDGRRALAAAATEHVALIKRFLLDPLTLTEQHLIADTMDRLSHHMRQHRDGEPCPRCDAEA